MLWQPKLTKTSWKIERSKGDLKKLTIASYVLCTFHELCGDFRRDRKPGITCLPISYLFSLIFVASLHLACISLGGIASFIFLIVFCSFAIIFTNLLSLLGTPSLTTLPSSFHYLTKCYSIFNIQLKLPISHNIFPDSPPVPHSRLGQVLPDHPCIYSLRGLTTLFSHHLFIHPSQPLSMSSLRAGVCFLPS